MSLRPIPYLDLPAQYEAEKAMIHACVEQVFRSGDFVGGAFIPAFEAAVARYVGTRRCVAVASGTDALMLSLKAAGIGPGDDVVTVPNSFLATTAAIVQVGARPVFCDVGPDQNLDPALLEAAITPRTRAILPVHLTGRICDMKAIMAIAERYGLAVIEDAAQAIGAAQGGRRAGSFGRFGCFSAHPVKNLNAAGDAGFVTTDDEEAADRIALLRRHGLVDRDTALVFGLVSRLDNLQAAILLNRLERLEEVLERRRRNAALYRELLDPERYRHAPCAPGAYNTFHTFVVRTRGRNELKAHLERRGIGSAIHYPVPIHLQPAAAMLRHRRGDFPMAERQAEEILSLPVHQYLEPEDIRQVAAAMNEFGGGAPA